MDKTTSRLIAILPKRWRKKAKIAAEFLELLNDQKTPENRATLPLKQTNDDDCISGDAIIDANNQVIYRRK